MLYDGLNNSKKNQKTAQNMYWVCVTYTLSFNSSLRTTFFFALHFIISRYSGNAKSC